ncbi:MAG: hypothetical protein KKF12_17630 [Proteobacteria bacterium]|nr:hypothetical protein [Desulfobacula sp.]MBU3952167.1 hypothetical protein [Pseudomonadota bacterium]MBU4132641.1 hypothetical protein [Pseudomonadota bacterium]
MKTLLENAQAAIREKLAYIRPVDVFITPHENFIPRGTQFPAIGIKDGNIKSVTLMGGDSSDQTLAVKYIPFVKMYSGEKSIMGDGSTKGILDVTQDLHTALRDNFLDIPEMEDVTCEDEKESESFGQPGDGLQRKIITYKYEKRV